MFEPMNFINNLKYMGVGMLGVFLIVGVIIATTYLIGYVMKKVEAKNQKESENN